MWLENPAAPVSEHNLLWKGKFMEIIDKHFPVKKMTVRKNDVPYMNAEWKAAIRKKRKYGKRFSKDKSTESWELMKTWRNQATRLRRKTIRLLERRVP